MKQIIKSLIYCILFLLSIFSCSKKTEETQKINSHKNDSLRIEKLNALFYQEVYTNTNKAKEYYKTIFLIANKNNRAFGFSKAYNLKGIAYDLEGKFDSSKYCYKLSINFAKKAMSFSTEASALNNLGLLAWDEGNLFEALNYYNKALTIFEKLEKKEYQANVMSNIGLIYQEIDDLEKAHYYLNNSLQIRKDLNDEYGLSVSYINLGILYQVQKDFKNSILFFKKGIDYKRKTDDLLGIAIANNNLSESLVQTGQLKEALKVLQESQIICIKNNAESNILENTFLGLAEVYIGLNDIVNAKIYNEKSLKIIEKLKDNQRLQDYYENQESIALLEKKINQAYFFSKKKDSIYKLVEGLELKKSIHLFETKYQTEKKEKELLKSKALTIEREAQIKKKNAQFILLSLFVLGIIVVSYLIYRQQKLKNKQQDQEFKLKTAISVIETQNKLQEQRLNISRDLHDNIGSQLTFIISSVDNVKYAFDINNQKLDDKLSNISSFAKETIVELRDTIWAMNSNEISFEDLESRIHNFIEKAKEAKDEIQFSFETDADLKEIKLTSIEGMNVYRSIQEAINNAIKYANASIITIVVKRIENQIQITIQDNGIGFDETKIEKGNGLQNMQKRVEDIGGIFNLESSNLGTTIKMTLNP